MVRFFRKRVRRKTSYSILNISGIDGLEIDFFWKLKEIRFIKMNYKIKSQIWWLLSCTIRVLTSKLAITTHDF